MRETHKTSGDWHTFTEGDAREERRRERRERRKRVEPQETYQSHLRDSLTPEAGGESAIYLDETLDRSAVCRLIVEKYGQGEYGYVIDGKPAEIEKMLAALNRRVAALEESDARR